MIKLSWKKIVSEYFDLVALTSYVGPTANIRNMKRIDNIDFISIFVKDLPTDLYRVPISTNSLWQQKASFCWLSIPLHQIVC